MIRAMIRAMIRVVIRVLLWQAYATRRAAVLRSPGRRSQRP
jgi:hypothetical protein